MPAVCREGIGLSEDHAVPKKPDHQNPWKRKKILKKPAKGFFYCQMLKIMHFEIRSDASERLSKTGDLLLRP